MPLDPPPLDQKGNVLPHDHQQIEDNHGVIRRISPHHLVEDEKIGGLRVSSVAFSPSSGENGGMSIDLTQSIVEAGLNPATYVVQPPFIGAVSFIAGKLRLEEFKVGFDPLPENPHHGEVWGTFTRQQKKKLQSMAEMLVAPKAL